MIFSEEKLIMLEKIFLKTWWNFDLLQEKMSNLKKTKINQKRMPFETSKSVIPTYQVM